MSMYAKVKILQDGKMCIVHKAVVKHFHPTNITGFEWKKVYKVFRDGDGNTRCDYYDAEIIRLTGESYIRSAGSTL